MVSNRMTEMDTRTSAERSPDLVAVLLRQWFVIVLCGVLGAAAGWFYTSTRPPTYESRATVLLIAAGGEQSPGGGLNRSLDVDTWATVARSTVLLQDVADELGLPLGTVRSKSSVQPSPTGDVLLISFTSAVSAEAARGAEVYSEQFLQARRMSVNAATIARAENLRGQRDELIGQIDRLTAEIADEEAKGDLASQSELGVLVATRDLAIERLASVNTELASTDTDVETGRVIIDPQTAVSATGFSVPLATIVGLLAGLLVGLILALLRDRYDTRYASRGGAEVFGLREVGRVPYEAASGGGGKTSEYTRTISRLNFARSTDFQNSIAVLLLPVESESLPDDVSWMIAGGLEAGGLEAGIVVDTLDDGDAASGPEASWKDTTDQVDRHRRANDIVLVPTRALDQTALGIGLATAVDQTLVLVSDRTTTQQIQQVLDDLYGVEGGPIQVLVVTGVKRRHLRRRRNHPVLPLASSAQHVDDA